jgi:hypothetical protein
MKRLTEYIKNLYEDNLEIFVFVALFVLSCYLVSCKKETPPVEPKMEQIQDSIREEVSQKKLNYILQSVKRK